MADENKEVPQTQAPKAPAASRPEGKPKNCTGCNRVLKRKSWYYRDGKYYCKKKCWQEAVKKAAKTEKT